MRPTMRDVTERLKTLQALDLEIRKLRKEGDRWPAVLSLRDQEIATKASTQQRSEEALKKARGETKTKEGDLRAAEEALVKLNVTLNTVKTNKEYSAVLNEIAQKKDDISAIEEAILVRMEEQEARARDFDAARAVVAAAVDERAKLARQAEADLSEIEAELSELQARRTAHVADLPADILEQFDRIAQGRDGLAVVGVVDGVCQGCFINLTAQEINLLMGADNLIRCKNCSRILYLAN